MKDGVFVQDVPSFKSSPSYEFRGAKLFIKRYGSEPAPDAIILVLEEPDEYPESLSVNLFSYGMVPPPNHIYVKDYAEREGTATELELKGIATKVKAVTFGFGTGYLMELNFDAEALLNK